MKKRIKLLAYILTCGMTLTGCKMNYQELLKKPNASVPSTSTTQATGEEIDDELHNETIEQIIVTNPEIFPSIETTEPLPTETTKETEPPETTEETEPPETTEETIPETEYVEPLIENNAVVTATTGVNIRTGSTTDALKIGTLNLGEQAIRLLYNNGWSLVKTKDIKGYIKDDYLEQTGEIIEFDYNIMIKNDIVITTSGLNMRSGPSTNDKIVTQIPKDTELQVLGETDNGWLLVKYNDLIDFVHADYTKSLKELAQSQYPELCLEDFSIEKIVYSSTLLNVRSGNSTDNEIIGQLEKYESVRVLGEYDEWYFVMTNDHNFGFVNKNYTKELDGDYIIIDKSEQQLYMYNGTQLYYTTPVTTGADSTPSDTGLFKIYAKETDRYLTDGKTYNAWVAYWMPYNGGEGLHDANWRGVFGTESYHYAGSHGCINMPPEISEDIYNNARVGTKVLVHK